MSDERPILCDVQDEGEARYAQGLQAVFGFRAVHNVWPALHAAEPVVLFGWREFYCEATGAFPGRCWIYWTRGWAETEADAASSRLATVLHHADEGRIAGLLWADAGDVRPPQAVFVPPVWPEPSDSGIVERAATGQIATDGSVAAVLAARHAGAIVRIPSGAIAPATSDLRPGVHERAELLRAILGRGGWESDAGAIGPPADLWIDLTPAAWSWRAFDAIRRGTPVLASASLAWTGLLPDAIADACVAQPATATALLASMARAILSDRARAREIAGAQAAAIEALRVVYLDAARASLQRAGFMDA